MSTERRSADDGAVRRSRPEIFSAAAGVAAVAAPAALTGLPVVDGIERALLAAGVSYVGAHGRRWAWLAAAAAIAVPARGVSMALALVALAIVVGAAWRRKRSRVLGAVGIGVMVNAALWYPPSSAPAGPLVAVVAFALLLGSGTHYLRPTKRVIARRTYLGLALFVVAAGVLAGVAMGLAALQVQSGGSSARSALDAARDGDAPQARADLADASSSFETAAARVDGPLTAPARLVPGLSQQITAVSDVVGEGRAISGTADDLVATADYDSLQYEGRLDVAQVRSLAGPTARADRVLRRAERHLDRIGDGYLLPPLSERVDQLSDDIADARRDTELAAQLLDAAPGLFGADGDRRYLVVFMTPAELRASGGFIGSYAELTASDGDVELSRSGRISELIFGPNAGHRKLTGLEEYVARYGRAHPQEFVQDATVSPHFPSVAEALSQIYPQAGGQPVDGVIAIDPTGLAALLELTGPVEVEGIDEPLTSENAVELLTRQQYIDLPDEAQRGEILTEATRATFDELVSSALPAPREMADALSPAARAGHLKLWSPDPDEQALFERLGADGSLEVPRGADGFSVIQSNAGNNKLDAYLHREISYLPVVDADTGALTAELRIVLHNDVPSVDLPSPVVDNTRGVPKGTNLTAVSVFTPNVVTEAVIDGKAVKLGSGTEEGLNVWDTPLLQIPPGGKVEIRLRLAGGVDLRRGYRLTILPQPVANPDVFTVNLGIEHGVDAETGSSEAKLLDETPLVEPTRLRVGIDG